MVTTPRFFCRTVLAESYVLCTVNDNRFCFVYVAFIYCVDAYAYEGEHMQLGPGESRVYKLTVKLLLRIWCGNYKAETLAAAFLYAV